MKKILHIRSLLLILAFLLVAAVWPKTAAYAADSIYVNDSSSVLPGQLDSAYAIGGGGAISLLPDTYAYVMTGSGLTTVGEAEIIIPAHLYVSGSVNLSYSKVRVGLYYYDLDSSIRNPTLESANLENAVGSGYRFGWYDSSRNFNQVGYTSETRLTMAIDKNIDTTGGHIGCYHILLSGTYSDFDSAGATAAAYTDGFPAYYNGTYYALVGDYDCASDASADAAARGISGTAYSASERCVVVTRTSDAKILFEFDCGTEKNLAVSPQCATGKAVTWFKGYQYCGDFEYVRRTGEKMTVINIVDVEDYVKGVIIWEMNGSWPLEALKAQALCARTFAAAHIGTYGSYGFDITNDTYSQCYRGISSATAASNSAVDSTAGQYITYNGSMISAMYSSSFGGGSENSENIFSTAYGYLRGKVDPFEAASNSINKKSSWSYSFTKAEITSLLQQYGRSTSAISSLNVTYSDTDNAIGLLFTDTSGRTVSLAKSTCYVFSTSYLDLPSVHYTATDMGTYIVFSGGGYGHNVGMSQYGAYAMATAYGLTYDQIINFYYTGVAIKSGNYA
ncbi:MAG: SpoIID/LytB domain-containing protein [Clostridia bacterium]|nr:SpoIID/LytB domain-containing protein [Clostridia bacterium]